MNYKNGLLSRIGCSLALSFLFLSAILLAKEIKIGYVDVEKLLLSYEGTREVKRELEKEVGKYRIQSDSLRRIWEEAKREFESKKLMLTAEGRRMEEERIRELERRYNEFVADVWGEGGKIATKNQELIAPVVRRIQEAIEKTAKERNITIVFDASQQKILYAQPGLDLTDDILTELRREVDVLPSLPAVEKKVAIIAFYEGNPEARADDLGSFCLTSLYQLLEGRARVKVVERPEVKRALSFRELKESDEIEKEIVYELGKELNANLCLTGTVTKSGRRITVEIACFDIDERKEFKPEKAEATRREELKAKIGEIVKRILRTVVGE